MPQHNETIDDLVKFNLRITQPGDGYRFSLDPLLLCDFAAAGGGGRIADLGTGCGVIPLVLARMNDRAEVVGVEFREEMAELARRNVVLNGLDGRISVLQEDVVNLKPHFPVSSFDLVVANPPYRKQGTGKISPKAGRDTARHESTAGLTDFLAAAKYMVKPAGRICFIYHPSRLVEFLAGAEALKLAPLRLRLVHGNESAEARMFMIELVKGRRGELTVQPPLLVYNKAGSYSDELLRILEGR